jgi:hypothetical protein
MFDPSADSASRARYLSLGSIGAIRRLRHARPVPPIHRGQLPKGCGLDSEENTD